MELASNSARATGALILALSLLACDGSTTADAGPTDTGATDTGAADAGPSDAEPTDTGPADTGAADAGPADTGPADAGPADTGAADAGMGDTGPLCPDGDDDADGVCDAADACLGFDDRLDGDGDGTPDGCDCDATTCGVRTVCREAADGAVCLPDADEDGWEAAADCDDGDDRVHPGAAEVCDGVDTDCDPATGEPDALLLDGAPVASVWAGMTAGGTLEICGVFPYLGTSARFANPITVIGRSTDAAIVMHPSTPRMEFLDAVDATFEGLTIRADPADEILGIRMYDATLTLTDVVFRGLRGPVTMSLGVVTMTGGEISGSRDRQGVYLDRSDATFTNVLFDDNEARERVYGGGALLVSLGSTATLTGCTLTRNRNALGAGGAVYLGVIPGRDWGAARLTATGCSWGAAALDNAPDDIIAWYGPGTTGAVVDDVVGDIRCVANSSASFCAAP